MGMHSQNTIIGLDTLIFFAVFFVSSEHLMQLPLAYLYNNVLFIVSLTTDVSGYCHY